MPHTPSTLPQAGDEVSYQGETYTVRAVDGNVLELAYHTGGFFRLVHASSVTVCPSPATNTAASLPAPAAGQGEGIHAFAIWLELEGRLAIDEFVSCSPAGMAFQDRIDATRPFIARRKATEICLELLEEYLA